MSSRRSFRPVYAHTNLVAENWRMLAEFYQQVFDCRPLPPERNYEGPWITDITGIEDVALEGIHLRLPRGDDDQKSGGPTLEIFSYSRSQSNGPPAANRLGFAHIAFHVDDVDAAREAVIAAGGKALGKAHTMQVPGAGTITLIYMCDPEGNIVELQNWS